MTSHPVTDPATDHVDDRVFRAVMSRFATGVTVMTALDVDGEAGGMTANAIASLSLHPLLVLVCVAREADMAQRVTSGGHFALSMLPAGADDVSTWFADPERSRGWEAFAHLQVDTAVTGAPILADAIGWLDCRVHDVHDGGDHLIVVGEVVAAAVGGDQAALGYFRSGYVTVPRPD